MSTKLASYSNPQILHICGSKLCCIPLEQDAILHDAVFDNRCVSSPSVTPFCDWLQLHNEVSDLYVPGPLIRMIIEITKDMIPFLGVLLIMTIGFSGAFYILFTPDVGQAMSEEVPSGFIDFQSTLLSTFLMILGSFDISTFMDSTPHSEMAIAMFCLYQVLGMIVLLNLLIAIMGTLRLLSTMSVGMFSHAITSPCLRTEAQKITGDTFDRVREMESLHFWKGRCATSHSDAMGMLARNWSKWKVNSQQLVLRYAL